MASIVVLTMLFIGWVSVKEYPEVWQCVLNRRDFGFFGLNFSLTDSAHNLLPICLKKDPIAVSTYAYTHVWGINTNHDNEC